MKKFIICLTLIVCCLALTGQAQSSCKKQSIQQLANNFAKAFESKTLARIDATKPFLNKITIRIENSLSGDGEPGQFEFKQVKNFTTMGKWLKSKEIEGYPNRSIEPLIRCRKGICTYNIQGLLHNTWFLQKISYGYKKDGCPYIKSVFIIDGN